MSCIDGITSEKVAQNPPVTHKPRTRRKARAVCDIPLADHRGELKRLRGKVDQHYEFIAKRPNAVLDWKLLAHLNKLIEIRLRMIDECELEQAQREFDRMAKRIARLEAKRIAALDNTEEFFQ